MQQPVHQVQGRLQLLPDSWQWRAQDEFQLQIWQGILELAKVPNIQALPLDLLARMAFTCSVDKEEMERLQKTAGHRNG